MITIISMDKVKLFCTCLQENWTYIIQIPEQVHSTCKFTKLGLGLSGFCCRYKHWPQKGKKILNKAKHIKSIFHIIIQKTDLSASSILIKSITIIIYCQLDPLKSDSVSQDPVCLRLKQGYPGVYQCLSSSQVQQLEEQCQLYREEYKAQCQQLFGVRVTESAPDDDYYATLRAKALEKINCELHHRQSCSQRYIHDMPQISNILLPLAIQMRLSSRSILSLQTHLQSPD